MHATTSERDFGRPAVGPERSGLGAALAVLVLLVLVLGAGYVWAVVNAGGRLAPGTVVAGVRVGGLAPSAAEVALRDGLAAEVAQDVTVEVDGTRAVFSPTDLGLSVDYTASVTQALRTPVWLPSNLWRFYTRGERWNAVVKIDRPVLLPLLEDVVAGAEREPVEGEIRFSRARYEVVRPVDGTRVDRATATETLRREWLSASAVELPLQPVSPEIDTEAVRTAVAEIAEPVVQAPVTLRTGVRGARSSAVRFAPVDYTDLLSVTPQNGRLVLTVNQERLPLRVSLLVKADGGLDPGQDASFEISDGRPEVVPAVVGRMIEPIELVERFRAAVTEKVGEGRSFRVPLQPRRPQLTTRAAEQLQVTERVASVTIPYRQADFRDINLARAAGQLDGSLMLPGESLSFNDAVGPPTRERGFVQGPLYDDGQAFSGAGAGLSRLATALAAAAWRSGLDLTQRSPMPWHPEEYPIGVDAAVQYGSVDLVISNPSPYGVLVTADAAQAGDRRVTVHLWSTEGPRVRTSLSAFTDQEPPIREFVADDDCVRVPGQPGFEVTASRTLESTGNGSPLRTDELSTTYRPLPDIVCVTP